MGYLQENAPPSLSECCAQGKASMPTPAAALGNLNLVSLRKPHDRSLAPLFDIAISGCRAGAACARLRAGFRARRLRQYG